MSDTRPVLRVSRPVLRVSRPELPETTEQKLARLEQQNLILMDALATVFEEIIALGGEEE